MEDVQLIAQLDLLIVAPTLELVENTSNPISQSVIEAASGRFPDLPFEQISALLQRASSH
jgi:hypothetical protein